MNNKSSGRVTVKDIAKAVGVSATAVSMALNDRGSLTEKRREEIKRVAAGMGYVPNVGARALRGCSTQSLGVVVNYFNNPFFQDFFTGLENVIDPIDFSYWGCQTLDKLERERSQVKKLAQLGVDGLIVLPCSKETSHLEDLSRQYEIPLVLINHLAEASFSAVVVDNVNGASQATEHLLSVSNRPVLHITGPDRDKLGVEERYHGYCQAMEKAVSDFSPEKYVFFAKELTSKGGYQVMKDILAQHKPPFSLFVVNDEMALGVLHCCQDHNLRVPEDVAIVGFSDMDILDDLNIPLSSVAIPGKEMGQKAAELLLGHIKNGKHENYTVKLPISLVIRDSSRLSDNG